MTKLIKKKVTTTVTEEMELIPSIPGEEQGHRLMKVHGYGTYHAANGKTRCKPKIILNARWLAEAGFEAGEQIDVEVRENELVIRKLCGRKTSAV